MFGPARKSTCYSNHVPDGNSLRADVTVSYFLCFTRKRDPARFR